MTTKSRTQPAVPGKGRGASAATCKATSALLHALSHDGGFDFINNMIGETVEAVSAGLGIGPPDNWRDPGKGSSVEDLARWFAKIPPTFDPDDAQPAQEPAPEQLMVVPVQDAERLVRNIAALVESDALTTEDDAAGAFLLLLHSMAYCPAFQREYYLFAAQRVLLPATPAFAKAADALLEDAVCAFKRDALGEGGE